jgi:hypothetical protein
VSAAPPRRRRSGLLAAALAVTGVVLLGCPFDPRDPEPPRAPTPCDGVLQQNSPADVRRKIVRAFACGLLRPDYEECLAANFIYEPDLDALSHANPGFFDAWTPQREVTTMELALQGSNRPQNVRARVLRFRDTRELTGDQARFDVQYELSLEFTGGSTLRYAGCAIWDFVGLTTFPVKLRRWADVAGFGLTGCIPDSVSMAGMETSGFLRFDRGR